MKGHALALDVATALLFLESVLAGRGRSGADTEQTAAAMAARLGALAVRATGLEATGLVGGDGSDEGADPDRTDNPCLQWQRRHVHRSARDLKQTGQFG